MSMLDSFFTKGFKGSKCKTLLKLTIPRIKLLRNRRELQIKQMRKDIAKLLETGQEATARIRVEHIIREENMMAAQEIIELFCELISVRLPIIESQRECPLDLKEAISSICFAAPRCEDLPELLQVQMSFASKYGREFIAAATELMPDCGVNRQIVELLSVRAPSAEKKLKLLKEIAEEHELAWDPAPSETELFKSHEDLLNGPTNFVGGAKMPLPKEKHDDEISQSASVQHAANEQSDDPDEGFDELDFPEVPKVSLRPGGEKSEMPLPPPQPSAPHPDEPDILQSGTHVESERNLFNESTIDPEDTSPESKHESPNSSSEIKQFVPFISPPSLLSSPTPQTHQQSQVESQAPRRERISQSSSSPPPKTRSDANVVDLNDVLAAAKAAAESAERAAAAARSAASLAEVRISELTRSKSEQSADSECENPFHATSNNDDLGFEDDQMVKQSKDSTYDELEADFNSSPLRHDALHQPQRIPSMDNDDPYLSYPNLFTSQSGNVASNYNSDPRNGL